MKKEGKLVGENYYEILDLTADATDSDIKRAYIKKLRQYPNEKFPEEFKRIRKAYDVLSNPISRKEYDTMSIYGDEIERLQKEANAAIDAENYEKAIDCYKKILIIEPSLLHIRNDFALALSYNGEYDQAIRQFNRIIQDDPKNAVAHYHLATVYEMKEEFNQAIHHYKQAFELDPSNINIIFTLSDLYVHMKEYTLARNTITETIKAQQIEGFQQFMYLFKHLQIDIYATDMNGLQHTLSKIETLLESYPEEKAYVAQEFGKFAYDLYEYKQYKWAQYLTDKGIELDPSNEALQNLHESTKENKVLVEEFELLENDDKIIQPIKYALFLYLYGDEFDEDEYKQNMDQMFHNVDMSSIYEPDNVIHSLLRLDIKYPNLYKTREEFFQKVLSFSQDNKKTNDQYDAMKNDGRIVNSIKRLIALYLSDVSDDERKSYFDDIIDEMSYEPASDVIQSINLLQGQYSNLYYLNTDFLNEIKQKLSEDQYRTEPAAPSSSSNYSTNSNASNSSACFVATAAFGSPLAKELDFLRYWRDEYLRQSYVGNMFIKAYYKVGPYLAVPVEKSNLLKKLTRRFIYKIIQHIDKKHHLRSKLERR